MDVVAVAKAALISDCGLYRYTLSRQWDGDMPSLPIIMLNPSTADADNDDPTIKRCISFGKREGFGGIRVFNLFAYRATSPADMKAMSDPIGPMNAEYLWLVLRQSGLEGTPVLCAWGTHGAHRRQDRAVRVMAQKAGARLVCLGMTKDGHPKHPLYVLRDAAFVSYTG